VKGDDGERAIVVDRDADEPGWLAGVYSDRAFVTQHVAGHSTSSSSMPSLVFSMLTQSRLVPGQSFLEIGTGTGWNAGMTAYRLGDANVATIEIDGPVAERARENLRTVDRFPTVVIGDGERGHPGHAPYDRIEATCSVYTVPRAWVSQLAPGGRLVTPWRCEGTSLLLTADADGDGGAAGMFAGETDFMDLRAQYHEVPDEPDDFPDIAERTSTPLDAVEVLSGDSRKAVALRLPDVKFTHDIDKDSGYLERLWLLANGAWASIDLDGAVRQAGERRLWEEVADAHAWWVSAGQPTYTRFGVAINADGGQWVYLDDRARVVAALPDHAGVA
jgi:protein-L-isoaspartate O-methyltransferase